MIKRERRVNVEALSVEQILELEKQISNKLDMIINKACQQANQILKVYGLKAKMQFALDTEVDAKQSKKAKKK